MRSAYWTAARLAALDTQLSGRDRVILDRIAALRFVTGTQIKRLYFPDSPPRTSREALLRLVRLGLLERLPRPVGGVRAGSSGFVYRLGPAGQRLLGRAWRPHIPGTLFLAHSLQIAELHTLLVEADRTGQVELLEAQTEPACWRGYPGGMLKPDSYLRLGIDEYEDSYFIEVDMSTEGSRALTTKLRQYVEYRATGGEQSERDVFPRVLWLAPDAARVAVIWTCIEQLPGEARELFAACPFVDVLAFLTSGSSGAILQRLAQ